MKYLVDADVLSEATKPRPKRLVVDWLRQNETAVAVDPVILGEVRFGIHLLPPSASRARLERWFDEGVRRIACLSWDEATGLRWARLLADLRSKGRPMAIKDSLIAATALTHDLAIATLNGRDFSPAGIEIVDPSA